MRNGKAVWLSEQVNPKFGWRHLPQPDLGSPVVAAVDIVNNFHDDFAQRREPPQVEFVLCLAEEAFHRRLSPQLSLDILTKTLIKRLFADKEKALKKVLGMRLNPLRRAWTIWNEES